MILLLFVAVILLFFRYYITVMIFPSLQNYSADGCTVLSPDFKTLFSDKTSSLPTQSLKCIKMIFRFQSVCLFQIMFLMVTADQSSS